MLSNKLLTSMAMLITHSLSCSLEAAESVVPILYLFTISHNVFFVVVLRPLLLSALHQIMRMILCARLLTGS